MGNDQCLHCITPLSGFDPLTKTFTCSNPHCKWFGKRVRVGWQTYQSNYYADRAGYFHDPIRDPIWVDSPQNFNQVRGYADAQLADLYRQPGHHPTYLIKRCDKVIEENNA